MYTVSFIGYLCFLYSTDARDCRLFLIYSTNTFLLHQHINGAGGSHLPVVGVRSQHEHAPEIGLLGFAGRTLAPTLFA